MTLKKKLHNFILERDRIKIVSLKKHSTPVELATQLNTLVKEEIVKVDWKEGVIINLKKRKDLIKIKNKLMTERVTPEYMKVKKEKINKPYI